MKASLLKITKKVQQDLKKSKNTNEYVILKKDDYKNINNNINICISLLERSIKCQPPSTNGV